MEKTRDPYNLSLFVKLTTLILQILFNLAVVEVMLRQISAEQESYLHRGAPRY